jgi:hypothetical protein
MIVYPDTGYNSFISEEDADAYFETRLNACKWDTANKEMALMTAFRTLNELNIEIDLTEAEQLTTIQQAQCEQALHEVAHDPDSPGFSSVNLGGLLSVKLGQGQSPPDRYSKRALAILKPYLAAPTITRTR